MKKTSSYFKNSCAGAVIGLGVFGHHSALLSRQAALPTLAASGASEIVFGWEANSTQTGDKDAEAAKKKAELEAWRKTPLGSTDAKVTDLIDKKRYPEAIDALNAMAKMPGDKFIPAPAISTVWSKHVVYVWMGDMDGFYSTGEAWFDLINSGKAPSQLGKSWDMNGLVWPILDPASTLPRKDYVFALKVAKRLVELDKPQHSYFLDTLAWAEYWTESKAEAVTTETEAIALLKQEIHPPGPAKGPTISDADEQKQLKPYLDALERFRSSDHPVNATAHSST